MTALVKSTPNDKLAMANALANANLLPRAYQKNPANLLFAMEYADAIGVHPMTAIQSIHVIDGKPSASAQLIAGLGRRAGHIVRVKFDRKTMTATAEVIRKDDPDYTFQSVWDMDRARSANLTNKSVWKQYPDAMLKARAITEVARDAFPEALFGVAYTAEELGADNTDEEGAPVVQATVVADLPALEKPEFVSTDNVERFKQACVKEGFDPFIIAGLAKVDLDNLREADMPQLREEFKRVQRQRPESVMLREEDYAEPVTPAKVKSGARKTAKQDDESGMEIQEAIPVSLSEELEVVEDASA
jgi:hypothetical protein